MKITAILAILVALASLAFLGLTFNNLLSGALETRSCQTECVRSYYFAATGLSIISFLLACVAMFRARFSSWSFVTFLFCSFPLAVIAGIFAIGTSGFLPT